MGIIIFRYWIIGAIINVILAKPFYDDPQNPFWVKILCTFVFGFATPVILVYIFLDGFYNRLKECFKK